MVHIRVIGLKQSIWLPDFVSVCCEISEDEFAKRTKDIRRDKDEFPVETPPSEEVLWMAEGVMRKRFHFPYDLGASPMRTALNIASQDTSLALAGLGAIRQPHGQTMLGKVVKG